MKKFALVVAIFVLGSLGIWYFRNQAPQVDVSAAPVPEPKNPQKSDQASPTTRVTAPKPSPTIEPAPAVSAPSSREPAPPTPMLLAEVLQANNRFFDPKFGVMATYPADWSVRQAMRWGVNGGENTVFFSPPAGSQAVPSMYYRKYSDGPGFDMANPEATLRDMARQKEESRSGGAQNDYKNDPGSFVFRTVDGNASLSYFATYTNASGEVHAEYFLRILGPTGYVMFFTRGPSNDVRAAIPAVFEMGGTVKPP